MFGDMHRIFRQFDMLNDLKIAGERQPKLLNDVVVDFIFDRFINAFRRQRLTQLSLMPRLSATFTFLASPRFVLLRFRLDNIARRRLGRSGRIFQRLRQRQFEFRNPPLKLRRLLRNPLLKLLRLLRNPLLKLCRLLVNQLSQFLDYLISTIHDGRIIANSLK